MAISQTSPVPVDAHINGAAVNCPKCGSSIPITEALSQQARDSVGREYELKRKELEQSLAEREQKLQASAAELAAKREKIQEEVAAKLQAERAQITVALRKEVETQKALELTALQEQLQRKTQQMDEASKTRLQLLRQKADLEEKERNFKIELQQQTETIRAKLAVEAAARLQAECADAASKARREISEQKATELAALQQLLTAREKQVAEGSAKELQWLQQKADLEDQKRNLGLEMARQLDAERAKVADQARLTALEESRLKMLEKDKQADDLRRQIETLQQKANQGSMQAQGEVLELDFEARLRAQFPGDEIAPVATGQRGADVQQIVRATPGTACGSILWEAKRTRNWSAPWIAKLKADQREAQAELAVIVTQALPKEITTFGCVEGIWVTDFASALPLAVALRQGILNTAAVRQAESGKQGKKEELYSYFTSTEFRQKIEAVVDAFATMRKDLEAERTAMERMWTRRERQLRIALLSTANIYDNAQAILGATALPDVPILSLPEPDAP